MAKRKHTTWQTTFYKTQHRKLKIEQHVPHNKPEMNAGAPAELAVPDPLMTPVVKLLNITNIILIINI
jgi:hypothetical protein